MLRIFVSSFLAGVLAFSSPAYCQQSASPTAATAKHSYEAQGPHDGELMEVGKGEYHVEVVIEEKKKQISVYLLDKTAKSYIAIDAPFLAINLKIGGKPAQFKLKPVPQEIDQPGFSSCFGVASPELIDALHDSHSDARLALKITSKPYVVRIVHNHDHAGHDHAGHNHPAPKKK